MFSRATAKSRLQGRVKIRAVHLSLPTGDSTFALSLPPSFPLLGPHNLVTLHLRLHHCFSCAEGRWVVYWKPQSRFFAFDECAEVVRPFSRINSKPCRHIVGTCSTSFVRRKFTGPVLGRFCSSVDCGSSGVADEGMEKIARV